MIYTHTKIKRQMGAIVGLVFCGFLIFGLFSGFPVKTTQASNNYIENIKWYEDIQNNKWFFDFKAKTSFDVPYLYQWGYECLLWSFTINVQTSPTSSYAPFLQIPNCSGSGTYTFTAGQNYTLQLAMNESVGFFNSTHFIKAISVYNPNLLFTDTEHYYFSEFPTLTITFPHDNDEIAEGFDIQGSYTLPAGSGYDILMAGFFQAGDYDVNFNNAVNVFSIPVSEPSGSFDNFRISNYLPKDVYDIYFRFYGSSGGYELPFHISNVNIVSDLPYELPITYEIPPDIPVFQSLSAQTIYTTYSNYDTSTALFSAVGGAIEPVIIAIGDNLAFFSGQFKQENARDTGEQAGNAVLLVRSYTDNLNSFFNDLPISQVLFFYLITLVVVIVFRFIRLLIKLIPFV